MTFFRRSLLQFKRAPFLSAIIVGSLAIGIAANTIVFTWLSHAYFCPLPGTQSDGLVSVETIDDTGNYVATSWREYLDLAERVPSLTGVAAQRSRALRIGDSTDGIRASAQWVSGNFFSVLGVRPHLGRFFNPAESREGGPPVVVVSHDYWRRSLGGRADVIGQTLKLNDVVAIIIGVAPEGFRGGYNALSFDLWVPASLAPQLLPSSTELTARKARAYTMLARVAPSVASSRVQAELDAAATYLVASYTETNRGLAYRTLPLWRSPRGGQVMVASLATLQLFAVLVLVVVCTNSASLLLARASTRQREIGVRIALGATSRQILGQLLLESLTLSLVAASAGLLLALWGTDLLGKVRLDLPGNLPLHFATELDARALVFTVVLALGCGLLFGLAPAWQLARANVIDALRSGRGAVGGRSRLRDLLVGTEVAVALIVLVLAGAFGKSFHNASTGNPGFETQRTLLGTLDLGGRGYTLARATALYEDLLPRLRALPDIEAASVSSDVLMDLHGLSTGVFSIAGKEFDSNRKALYSYASPGHLATLHVDLRAGADLAPLGRTDLPLDAIINEEMARRYWPEGSPVGHRFNINDTDYVVAGIATDSRYERFNESPRPMIWLTLRSRSIGLVALHVRTRTDPRGSLGAIRAALQSVDPALSLLQVRTMAEHISSNLIMQRIPAQMLSALSPLALLLAAVGIYAVIAHSLAQRVQEIGVRLTMGSTPSGVVRLMVWQGFRVVLLGGAIGWLTSLAIGSALQSTLVGVPVGDLSVYGGVPLLVFFVAFMACWLPARRASRIDPMVALRAE